MTYCDDGLEEELDSPYWLEGGSWSKGLRPSYSALKYLETASDDYLLPIFVDLCGWLDGEREPPFYSQVGDFLSSLALLVPDLSALPPTERRLLVVASLISHERGAPPFWAELLRLRAPLGEAWEILVRSRECGYPGFHKLEKTSHRNLQMVARLIRLAEALNCRSCAPDVPGADELPVVQEPEEDLDLESRVLNALYPPLNTIERKEFWRRAYLSKSERGENGELRVRFDLPPGRLHLYQPWLVTPKVLELNFYLESLPEALKDYGILLGPLEIAVVPSSRNPPMSDEMEQWFERQHHAFVN